MKTFLKTCQILNIGEQRLDIDIELISEKKLRKASFMYVLLSCSYWLIKCNYTDEIWNPMRNVIVYQSPASHSLPHNYIKYISHNYSHRKIIVQIEIVLTNLKVSQRQCWHCDTWSISQPAYWDIHEIESNWSNNRIKIIWPSSSINWFPISFGHVRVLSCCQSIK